MTHTDFRAALVRLYDGEAMTTYRLAKLFSADHGCAYGTMRQWIEDKRAVKRLVDAGVVPRDALD